MPFMIKASAIGFALVIANMVLSWITAMVVGGFKVGSLERRVAFEVPQGDLAPFLDRFHWRIAELGFRPENVPGHFVQGGVEFHVLGGYTHAKTRKQLTIGLRDDGQPMVFVEMVLRYLDPILGDSGESAYRDAVLDYVSGLADAMRLVPNTSFSALSSLVGGVMAWVALLGLRAIHFEPLWLPIMVLGLTEISAGAMAIVGIRQKSREMTGTGLALGGIVVSVAAILAASALSIAKAG
jgi:hypothetical protein